jgi:hypothetical protein
MSMSACEYSSEKPKWQSSMDILEKLATLDTQDTGRKQTKQKAHIIMRKLTQIT